MNGCSVTGADCCDGNPLRRIGDEQKLTAYPATVCCSVAKLPLETRCNCFRYGLFTGHRPILANGSFLVS